MNIIEALTIAENPQSTTVELSRTLDAFTEVVRTQHSEPERWRYSAERTRTGLLCGTRDLEELAALLLKHPALSPRLFVAVFDHAIAADTGMEDALVLFAEHPLVSVEQLLRISGRSDDRLLPATLGCSFYQAREAACFRQGAGTGDKRWEKYFKAPADDQLVRRRLAVAKNPKTPDAVLLDFIVYGSSCETTRAVVEAVASNPRLADGGLRAIAGYADIEAALANETPESTLLALAGHKQLAVRSTLALRAASLPEAVVRRLVRDHELYVWVPTIQQAVMTPALVREIWAGPQERANHLLSNPTLPAEVFHDLVFSKAPGANEEDILWVTHMRVTMLIRHPNCPVPVLISVARAWLKRIAVTAASAEADGNEDRLSWVMLLALAEHPRLPVVWLLKLDAFGRNTGIPNEALRSKLPDLCATARRNPLFPRGVDRLIEGLRAAFTR